jgi:hypothetical protein
MSANLFNHAAERAAIATGRPLSQELLRVRGLDVAAAGPLLALAEMLSESEPMDERWALTDAGWAEAVR